MLEKSDELNIKSLRIFIYIIEGGTLAKAASRLHLSPPAASRLLRLLEDEIGIELFQRMKKRLIPTREGEAFYPEATRVLDAIDGIGPFIKSIQQNKPTPLRVVCLPRLSGSVVLPAIIKLSKTRPDIRVKLEIHHRRDLERGISRQLYDIGVSSLPIPANNVEPDILCRTRLFVALSKNHPLSKQTKLTIEDVFNFPYIALDQSALIQKVIDGRLTRSDTQLDVKYEVSNISAALQLVRANLGFTIVDPMAGHLQRKSDFRFVLLKPKLSINYGMFKTLTDSPHEALNDFVECLKDSCKEVLKNSP